MTVGGQMREVELSQSTVLRLYLAQRLVLSPAVSSQRTLPGAGASMLLPLLMLVFKSLASSSYAKPTPQSF